MDRAELAAQTVTSQSLVAMVWMEAKVAVVEQVAAEGGTAVNEEAVVEIDQIPMHVPEHS